MNINLKSAAVIFLICLLGNQAAIAQGSLLRKIKARAEDEVVKGIFGDEKKSDQPSLQQSSSNSETQNKAGGGLTHTAPNVPVNIKEAETAFSNGDYKDARYSVRQAILGIEMEIGENILEDLPKSAGGLGMISEEDQVVSMGIGFVGLTISRTYKESDQQLKITIGNDAAMLTAVNMYMSSAGYASTTDQDYKRVKLKGYSGILQYEDHSGYTLSVPFGQSSIFVANGRNFSDEDEIMAAAGEFDIEEIKTELGEQ